MTTATAIAQILNEGKFQVLMVEYGFTTNWYPKVLNYYLLGNFK